jgi:hypothetical protein
MQTILLVFIVIFALAIGFFLGMFLLSMDTPLTKRLTKKDQSPGIDQPAGGKGSPEIPEKGEKIRKPSPNSRLILQVWKEEGKPPVYDLDGTYINKENLPREILNVISMPDEEPVGSEVQAPPIEEAVPSTVTVEEETPEAEVKILSVIDEVNDILQKKLAGSPLAGKGIHLMENYNNEIRFWVGLNSYDDVEEIPEPEIRQIIDAAVKEWEENRE